MSRPSLGHYAQSRDAIDLVRRRPRCELFHHFRSQPSPSPARCVSLVVVLLVSLVGGPTVEKAPGNMDLVIILDLGNFDRYLRSEGLFGDTWLLLVRGRAMHASVVPGGNLENDK